MHTFPFPEVNASLNAAAFICLNFGFYFIKQKKIQAHKRSMSTALIFSTIFLISYLIYHYTTEAVTPFIGQGAWRTIYYSILFSHIVLAIVIVPLIIRTFYLSLTGQFEKHKKIARWTFPLWYYVSITGVLVYLFLYQWFPVTSRMT